MYKNIIGIYKIENQINGKLYIGSSMNIADRWKRHLTHFKYKNHKNEHLLNAWIKYEESSFKFSIIESFENITLEELHKKEEYWISKFNFDMLYNKTKLACGGSDAVSIPCYVLDLTGNIISEHKSIFEISRIYNSTQLQPRSVNSGAIYKRKYRVVSIAFYKESYETITSWKTYSNKTLHDREVRNNNCITLEKEGVVTKCKTPKEVAKLLNVSRQYIYLLFKAKKYKADNQILHKKSGYILKKLQNCDNNPEFFS